MIKLANFLHSYGFDEQQLRNELNAGLLDAQLLALKVSKNGRLHVQIRAQLQHLDGQLLHNLETRMAERIAVSQVNLFFETLNISESTATEALAASLAWLGCELQKTQPLLAQELMEAKLTELNDQSFDVQLSPIAYQKLDESLRQKILTFLRKRAALPYELTYSYPDAPCEHSLTQETETYFQNIQNVYLERQASFELAQKENKVQVKAAPASDAPMDKTKFYKRKKLPGVIWGSMYEMKELCPLNELTQDVGVVQFEGKVAQPEFSPTRAGDKLRVNFNVEGKNGAVSCLIFVKLQEEEPVKSALKKGSFVRVEAEMSYDGKYTHDLQARVLGFMMADKVEEKRKDEAANKRIELHAHTKFSTKDAFCDPKQFVKLAAQFGHEAVAITDHGVVQAFPDACLAADDVARSGQPIKLIYGMEGYLVDDGRVCVYGYEPYPALQAFVSLDVETTGLDCCVDRLIEVAAIRYDKNEKGQFIESARYQTLIQPGVTVPEKITQLTGITDFDLIGKPMAQEVLKELHAFIGELPVVAHNALFDLGFLRAEAFRTEGVSDPKLKFNPCLIDTLPMAQAFLPSLERHTLDRVAQHLGLSLDRHHRAEDDARCCAEVFCRLYEQVGQPSLEALNEKVGKVSESTFMAKKYPVHHIIFLVRNLLGMYNLYRLVSESHVRYIASRPRIPRSLLDYLRHGLLVGAACEAGEVFRGVRQAYVASGRNYEASAAKMKSYEFKKLARYYDYLEIQPLCNNRYLLNNNQTGILFEDDLIKLNQLVHVLAQVVKKPIVGTCDVHFLNREEGEYRKMMLSNMGYSDASMQADLYFRTTDEMLREFSYFGEAEARRIVIDNPKAIAAKVESGLRPFPAGSFPPEIPEAETLVKEMCYNKAKALYDAGEGLPEIVEKRIERELNSIISNGFAIMYYIAHKVVKQSNDDGYIVGSRGSVGSSLVATLCGITEVNPLAPHYYCPNCRYSEFDLSGTHGSGYDLPEKNCPSCGTALTREGQDIPFETFLGFTGEKQPDIDLNFSGDYQSRAHLFIEDMFGADFTFRAGTIGAYAEKNAEGLVRSYLETAGKIVPKAEISRLASAFVGVKRTTGQHPGGIVVIPKDRDIYEFTPVQYPADNKSSAMQTTHFDFNSLHDTILKLDILGHDDPTVLHMLSELTGVDVMRIPIPDPQVMAMFRSTEPLKFLRPSDQDASTLGIPEMGTLMARDMIAETKPSRFYDLVQLMGLSHGTDVWKGNAQDLIQEGICDINNVIGCRDSIMTTLIYKGLPSKDAFDIMEKVRKGKGLSVEHEKLMRDHQVEEWYIDSCKKIKYMFPKAHAVAYAISSLRVAWFKIYHPAAYYSAYFTVRADEFDSALMCVGLEQVMVNRRNYRRIMQERTSGPKEKNTYYILELVEEMYNRGISFLPIDLMASEASRFMPVSQTEIRPPFNVIPGFSTSMANGLVATREKDGAFHNKEEVGRRAQLGPAAMQALAAAGVLTGLPDSAQVSLFDLMDGLL